MFNRLLSILSLPVDAASLVAFRIAFGLTMAAWAAHDLISGRVAAVYQAPQFHFTYYLFDFVRPWPGVGMTLHFLALFVLALCIAAGFLYRVTSLLFALGFTHFFLIDRTNYQNHYYLLMLISWALAIIPLHGCFSLDALRTGASRSDTLPSWCLCLLRFQIALPYFFGGVAKLNSDWFAGEPLRSHLLTKAQVPIIGPLLASEATISIFIWGGLIFDLAVVPLLLWKRTRLVAFGLCVAFHLTNALLFEIHVFPWFMILATTLFFEPGWPRLLFRRPALSIGRGPELDWNLLAPRRRIGAVVLALYCVVQTALPFRHLLSAGDSNWTERDHHFSWRMMLRTKDSAIRYYLTDSKTGRTGTVDLRRIVTPEQLQKFPRDPEMILHLAHHLADQFRSETGRRVEVRALVLTTLNGRKPELLIDPNVDLAKEPRGFQSRTWVLPQREPLRDQPWTVPVSQWERHVEIPPMPFLNPTPKSPAESTRHSTQTAALSGN